MQLAMPFALEPKAEPKIDEINVDPHAYDHVIVFFSGGKDSVACVLMLLDLGVTPELWHHDVDGKGENFFDWPSTNGYVNSFGRHFELPVYHSWREGGLQRELLKENARSAPIFYENPDGSIGKSGGERGAIATRRRWPSLGSDLRTRWCSPSAKIDVGAAAIAGQQRFRGKKILVITGERAEESPARSRYQKLEKHRTHAPGKIANRQVTHWRPILDWSETDVWDIIERHKVVPHPCYRLGLSRASCLTCIFSSSRQAALVKAIDAARHEKICSLEQDFGHTIRRGETWEQHAGKTDAPSYNHELVRLALDPDYNEPAVTDHWEMPAGAFGEDSGPL